MYTMHVNVHFTRRKTLIFILDEHDAVRWSGTSYAQALDYLLENGEKEFWLEGPEEGDKYRLDVYRA